MLHLGAGNVVQQASHITILSPNCCTSYVASRHSPGKAVEEGLRTLDTCNAHRTPGRSGRAPAVVAICRVM